MEVLNGFEGSRGASHEEIRETIGMKRWMRQTCRKHSKSKPLATDTSKAAADALAHLLKGVRKHA